jgi:hypothetical protein
MLAIKVISLFLVSVFGVSIVGNTYQKQDVPAWHLFLFGAAITVFITYQWLL